LIAPLLSYREPCLLRLQLEGVTETNIRRWSRSTELSFQTEKAKIDSTSIMWDNLFYHNILLMYRWATVKARGVLEISLHTNRI